MSNSYKNNTRHSDLELAVSKGQINYNASQYYPGFGYFIYSYTPPFPLSFQYQNLSVAEGPVTVPDHHILPRGCIAPASIFGALVSAFGTETSETANFLATTALEGANDSTNNPTYNSVPGLESKTSTFRKPYSSKIIPIFDQGTEESAPITNGVSYSTLKLVDITLPYIKANIVRGETTSLYVSANPSLSNETAVQNYFYTPIYTQYPEYNAIEILICTKSLTPSGNYYHGGAWFKKTFLIHYDLVNYVENPLEGTYNQNKNIKYWRPVGLVQSAAGGPILSWERYNVYVNDTSFNNVNPSNVQSSWLADYNIANSVNLTENPLEIIQDSSNKSATIKIKAITQDPYQSNHTYYSVKGLAKLI